MPSRRTRAIHLRSRVTRPTLPFRHVKKPSVEQRREEILETTCAVVIERGFAATRISDVARRLDVSSSLIHYHFDSKEHLLAEAFSHYARKDLAEMEAEVESAPTALEQLDRAIRNYVPEGSDDVEWMLWIDGWGEALRNPMMRKISQELDEQSCNLVERVIARGVERGEFACPDPAAAALRLTALVDGLAVQFAAHDGLLDRTTLIDHVRSLAASEVGVSVAALAGSAGPDDDEHVSAPTAATDAALRQLVNRYCDAVIRHDVEEFAGLWDAEATWTVGGRTFGGSKAIVAAWDKSMSAFAWVVQSAPQMVFDVDERAGTGTGRVTVQERFKRSSGRSGSTLATAEDRYVRRAGQWRFAERRLNVIEAS
jgi:AcrR family transcriptional regulator